MGLIIRGGHLVNPKGENGNLDILVEGGKIKSIAPTIPQGVHDMIDLSGRGFVVAPGLVDVHVHFRDPGFTYKEDIISGANAAKAGGFTTVVMMGNTNPPIDNVETLKYVLEKGAQTGINVKSCANITRGMRGLELTDMAALAEAGAVGFTDDGMPILDEKVVFDAMREARALDLPLSFHEENPAYIISPGFNHGEASRKLGVGGADRLAETSMIGRDVQLALKIGAKISIQHISTGEGVEIVRQGKISGGEIYAEATPNHFSLTEDDVVIYGVLAKINPPIRTERDRQAIVQGLADGVIDMIVTDHAPHTMEEKMKGLHGAPSGIIGLETSLALSITNLVKTGKLSMDQLITRMSCNPANFYGFDAGVIKVGAPADIVIFNANEEVIVPERFASKACNSPYIGRKLFGKVYYTICGGKIVYDAN